MYMHMYIYMTPVSDSAPMTPCNERRMFEGSVEREKGNDRYKAALRLEGQHVR